MSNFDRGLARLLLEICRYTYAKSFDDNENQKKAVAALDNIQQRFANSIPTLLKGSSTSVATVTEINDGFVVSYMGTKTQFDEIPNIEASIKDWIQNIKFVPADFDLAAEHLGADSGQTLHGRVHQGFLDELKAVQPHIVNTLKTNITPVKNKVLVTGHSQGGAEAVLGTAALIAAGFNVVSTYTFAAPRTADTGFLKNLPPSYPFHRIEFGDDIVPHLPAKNLNPELMALVKGLKLLPFLNNAAKELLEVIAEVNPLDDLVGIGTLCYGSNKTKALRVDISTQQEESIFKDRLWSLLRNPKHWAEHHHLAGTSEEVKHKKHGNYTALVSDFAVAV